MPASNNPKVVIKPTAAEVRRIYQLKKSALLKMGPAFTKVSIFLDKWVQTNFKTQGALVGGWAPLKSRQGVILQDTGRLRISFVPFVGPLNAGIGSDLPYSKTHNKGTKHIPKRRMLPRVKDVIGGARKILKQHLDKVSAMK